MAFSTMAFHSYKMFIKNKSYIFLNERIIHLFHYSDGVMIHIISPHHAILNYCICSTDLFYMMYRKVGDI